MRHPWALLIAACCSVGAAAANPLESRECRAAVARLDALEAAPAPAAGGSAPAPSDALRAARQAVARDCLARQADPPTPPRTQVQPPLALPGTPPLPPQVGPAAGHVRPPPETRPPVQRQMPLGIVACDATGCFTSDGRRLQRAGPQLLGPTGLCNDQGGVLVCPR